MKVKEIRSLEGKALDEKLVELKKELIKLNAQVAVGTSIKNPGQVKKIKKSIARVLTIKQEKTQKADAKATEKKAAEKKKAASVDKKSAQVTEKKETKDTKKKEVEKKQ